MSTHRFDEIAINSTAKKKPEEDDKYHYIGLEHLDSGSLTVSRWGSDAAPKGEKLIMKEGDVLFGKRRAYQKKVAIAPFDGIFSAHGMVLRPNEKIVDKDFFPMFISSDYFLDAAIAISVGSLSPTINWKDLAKLKFDLPGLEEQKKTAKVLWAMHDTMEGYKSLFAATDELMKSQFIEMFGDTVSEHQNYKTVKLSKVFDKPQGGEWGDEDDDGTGVPVLRTTNFTDIGCIDYADVATRKIASEKVEKKVILNGDILIEKSGGSGNKPVGRVVFFDGESGKYLNNNFTAKLHLNGEYDIEPIYAFYFMFVNYWHDGTKLYEGKTTGIHNLHLADYLAGTSIPLAPITEQLKFASLVRYSDKSKFALQKSMANLRAMFNKVLSGNLDESL